MNHRMRIRKLEDQAGLGQRKTRLWVLRADRSDDEQIEEIVSGKVRHPDGALYSEKDKNYFVDEKFLPTT